ncbi:hypothetical protein JTE90_005300 [Oedothorax gibbosus]|uniref:Uncharacterized protein n=1 Tax=Oedothorax gibbosus TaxID=931172 RepID=A0AAV6UXA0_9ARAC|nr:hypothetical protein JTE90_005300 [Oedothorax gibbosus]
MGSYRTDDRFNADFVVRFMAFFYQQSNSLLFGYRSGYLQPTTSLASESFKDVCQGREWLGIDTHVSDI